MGISKSKLYTRNELLYANREAYKYGISKSRYNKFIKSSEYELAALNFDSLTREDVDASYITAWNNWKQTQSWGNRYVNLDKNMLVFLSNMPTNLNGLFNGCNIPKKHDEYQQECLRKFYMMRNEPINNNCTVEGDVNNLLDLFKYNDIVAGIKEEGNSGDWSLSQRLDSKWVRMIRDIRNSGLRDLSNLKFIKELCETRQDVLYDSMSTRIII